MIITESRLRKLIREAISDSSSFNIDSFFKSNQGCRFLIKSIKEDIEKILSNPKNAEEVIDFLIKNKDKIISEENSLEKEKIINKFTKLKKLKQLRKKLKANEVYTFYFALYVLNLPIMLPIIPKLIGLILIASFFKICYDFGKERGKFIAKDINNKFSDKIAVAIKNKDYKKVDEIKKEMKKYIFLLNKEHWKSNKNKNLKDKIKDEFTLLFFNYIGKPFSALYMKWNFDSNINKLLEDSFIWELIVNTVHNMILTPHKILFGNDDMPELKKLKFDNDKFKREKKQKSRGSGTSGMSDML